MTTPPAGVGNLADLVRRGAQQFGDRPALIGDGPVRSWAELDVAADTGAADLLESGARPGERVLIALPTSADLALVLIAAARAGLVAVPVDPERPEAGRVAGRVQAATAVVSDPGALTGADVGRILTPTELGPWWTGRRAPVDAIGGGEDLALLARASRSDRAVMIPHRAVLAAVSAIVSARGVTVSQDDRVILALPLHHLAGLVTAFLPLAVVGAAAVIPGRDPEDAGVEAADAALGGTIHRHRVTVLPGSPTIYRRLLQAPGAERSLASVRLMTSGAAPLLPEDFSAIRKLTGQSVWEGYGISESCSVVATSLMTEQARPGSVGLPMTGLQVRIVADSAAADEPAPDEPAPDEPVAEEMVAEEMVADEPADEPADESADDGSAASAPSAPVADSLAEVGSVGEVGRIALRGPTLFLGYWPDGADGPDSDGWYCTADIGYRDDRGELHLVDRVDDTFVVAGFTVYPREIERVLGEHPYVAEAVVVGLPAEAGTYVVALVSARPGTRPTDDDLAEWVQQRLPEFKRPNRFVLVGELPRTELGRIDRQQALADFVAAGGSAPVRETTGLTAVSDGETAAEPAGELDELGRRLPGTESRDRRDEADSDDDLFGEDYT